jgi:hypothetical protein
VIFRVVEDGGYLATDAEHGIEFHCQDVRKERSGELVGHLTVACGMLGTRAIDGPLVSGSINFSTLRSRDEWARRLARQARTGNKLDWGALLEPLCHYVFTAERDGDQHPVILRHVPPRNGPAPMFGALGMQFPKEHPASIFGPGDGFKSYLAMKITNEQARLGVRVAWFDWELDKHEHRERQAAIDPEMPDVFYVKCDRPLIHDVDRLRRIIRNE